MDLSRSVCLTFDPPLEHSGCTVWQLRRARRHHRNNNNSNNASPPNKLFTTTDADYSAEQEGFLLIAMNADGTTFSGNEKEDETKSSSPTNKQPRVPLYHCLAPSLTQDVVAKPLAKNSVTLCPVFDEDGREVEEEEESWTWQVERHEGGGIAFRTTLARVKQWTQHQKKKSRRDEGQNESLQPIQIASGDFDQHPHYLTDDVRLISTRLTDGQPAGFGMSLAYPPVVDVTGLSLLAGGDSRIVSSSTSPHDDDHNRDTQCQQKHCDHFTQTTARISRNLVEAAMDCGFFFAVIRHHVEESAATTSTISTLSGVVVQPSNQNTTTSIDKDQTRPIAITTSAAHAASDRVMDVVRRSFGKCIAADVCDRMKAQRHDGSHHGHEECAASNRLPLNSLAEQQQQAMLDEMVTSKKAAMTSDGANDDDQQPPPPRSPLLLSSPNRERLPAQLTKVTLKSTTGVVKTSINPPRYADIRLPGWMNGPLSTMDGRVRHAEWLAAHFGSSSHNKNKLCAQQNVSSEKQQNEDDDGTINSQLSPSCATSMADLDTYFKFGEEVASRMVALLLKGVAGTSSSNQWPTPELVRQQPELRGITPTTITITAPDPLTSATSSSRLSLPLPLPPPHLRVDPSQFYTLFRAVCYPPSSRNREEVDDTSDEEDEEDQQDDERSHKSDETDDSEGKALYEHTDKTWITILRASPSLKGLQVVDCDGSSFTEVKIPKLFASGNKMCDDDHDDGDDDDNSKAMCFVCNIGDALQMVSRGKYLSRVHRARNPRCDTAAAAAPAEPAQGHSNSSYCCCEFCRVSLPLFVEPSPERWPVSYQSEDVVMTEI